MIRDGLGGSVQNEVIEDFPMLSFVHALVFFAAVAASPAASDQLPVVSNGKMSSVVLLHAGRVSPDGLKACCPGAADALTLVFLTRSTDAPIDFAMSPVVRTLIDRRPYPSDAEGAQGPKPRIEVRDVDDVFREFPDLVDRVPAGFKPHLAIVVTLPGGTLPGSGQVDFSMELGYHRQVEPFSFAFALPKKQLPD
jgi:hypothetical protein